MHVHQPLSTSKRPLAFRRALARTDPRTVPRTTQTDSLKGALPGSLRGVSRGLLALSVGVALAASGSFSALHAASPTPQQAVAGDTVHLPEVVVTASRIPTVRVQLPQAVTVLSGAELEARGVVFLLDALREVPGLQVVQTGSVGGSTSVFLRGGNSNFVKVLLDGVPLNEPGGRFDFGTFTLENVERIEVVRGPSSVLYGSDAVTGVIQIFTKSGQGEPRVSANLRGGSRGMWGIEAAALGATDRLSYSASLGRSKSDGLYAFNSGFASLVASARVELNPDAGTRLALSARMQESVHRFPTDSNGDVVDLNQFTFDDGVSLSIEAGRVLGDGIEGKLLLRAAWAERGYENEPDTPGDTVGFGFRSVRLGNALRRGGDARLIWSGAHGTLTSGLDWEVERERLHSRTESNFGSGITVSSDGLRETRWNLAGYAEGLWQGPAQSRLNVGVRTDRNEVYGSFVTGQAGVVVPLPGALGRVRGSMGSAYKAPTFSHQFAGTAFEVGNPDLKPESSRAMEVGWDAGFFDNRLVVGGGLFHQRFDDLIQYAFRGAGLPSYWNEAKARARGGEASVRLQGGGGWELATEASWTDAQLRTVNGEAPTPGTDTRLLRRPARLVSAQVRAPLPWVGGRGGVTFTQVGSRVDQDFRSWPSVRVTLPSYVTTDVDVQVPLPAKRNATPAHVTVRVENARDQVFSTIVGFPGAGRTLHLGLRWNP